VLFDTLERRSLLLTLLQREISDYYLLSKVLIVGGKQQGHRSHSY
jgi:hypothetical protein